MSEPWISHPTSYDDCDCRGSIEHATKIGNTSVPAEKAVWVRDDGRVLVSGHKTGWVEILHQDHASYFVPAHEARALALKLIKAADYADSLGFGHYWDGEEED